ncbi:uncharacterized protein LOC116287250 [Actinia tenebrosa]|uniref:Metalloendopeptidase n=1 Tax=Actinia tenebrosa TaxID=6105 RepID=A0A6P8HAS9_ACTTE|nr:uncharacterized protein LOC116287250 [Actinia tenebrosa]XP_031549767.1 uncharacterized protein LOC116287250 [Actinia tenebrosa]XP_031549768.1 uncharacterized protein LOC116287250 [Actinia tenebrosa]XP_031549769.1 uncharacterized protein LOC116287250 [Actinia tenebrosa]
MELYLLVILALSVFTQAVPIKDLGSPAQEDGLVEENVHEKIYKINKQDDLNLYEGDIFIPIQERGEVDFRKDGDVDGELDERSKRNAVRDRKKIWLGKVVPYEFGYGFPVDYEKVVHEAIAEYHNKTCVRFKPKTDDKQWITFVYRKGCWSAVGRSYWLDGVGQEVSLGNGCNQKGTALHEIMHALGFWHEQSRPDRNQYVEVLWENIIEDETYNFNKYSHGDIDTLKIPYDFDSIMHYGGKSFSKNGQPTIRSILSPSRLLGQKDGFTNFDLQELNALYDCQGINNNSPWSSWSDFGPCSIGDCTKYRQRFCTSTNRQKDCPSADYYGVETNIVKCTKAECHAPVQGHWGRWSSWGQCDAPCGYGKQVRTRRCDDPPPRFNGTDCVGNSSGTQKCKARSCDLGPDDCEFDVDGMCFWSNDKTNNDRYQWERNDGETPSSATGPTGDHTSKTGSYLYAEASGPAQAGDKARLLSKTFKATEGRCLSFWYHMKGSGMGTLNVHIQDGNGERQVWSVSGNKGDQWQPGELTITSPTDYKVLFESIRGPDFLSDIALDDVKFKEGVCTEAIGCFFDSLSNRSFPKMMANLRPNIDWFNMNKTVQDCAKLAVKQGYKLFGLQFYGECWSGKESEIQYDKLGSDPNGCWEGVGKAHRNFVYKVL